MSSPSRRILHVFRAPIGGLFRHVLDVARGQVERGHAVGIFCDSSTGGARAAEALAELRPSLALGLERVPIRRQGHPSDLVALSRLAATCRTVRPDVLHGHGSKGGVFARVAPTRYAAGGLVARAYTPHGGSFNYRPGSLAHRFYMQVEAILARRTEAFLFESDYVKQRFIAHVGTPTAPAPVIHNGVAEAEFEHVVHRPDATDLVYIGELRYAKGIDVLLEALAILRREGRTLTLTVVGSGPDEQMLQDYAKTLGLYDDILFVPPRPIRAALEGGRVMVVPSKAESLPYVLLEAAAAGQPIVSTDVGGIPEIFGPHGSQLVKPSDPVGLARAILAKTDAPPALRDDDAERLRRYVRSGFRIDQMVDKVLAGYDHGFKHAARKRR